MGPIIKEIQTNITMAAGTSRSYNVKADGRAIRVFCKYVGDSGSTVATLTVKPIAHYSDRATTHDWPVISTGQTDGIVSPDTGTAALTATGAQELEVFVSENFACSEYEVALGVAGAGLTASYIVTELV